MKKRKAVHETNARKGDGYYLHRAMRKYGLENFEWSVLKTSKSDKRLYELEKQFIIELETRSPKGYNLSDGGEGNPGWVPSEEWREKKRQEQTGRKLSDSTKEKLRQANLGKKITEETRAKLKLRKPQRKGAVLSQETKDKISKSKMGKKIGPRSEETKKRMSDSHKGKKLSLEHRKKISRSMLESNHVVSDETRKRLSKATKQHWEEVHAKSREGFASVCKSMSVVILDLNFSLI